MVVAGNKLRMDVSITGEPRPVATWMKEDEVWCGLPSALTSPSQPCWVALGKLVPLSELRSHCL